MKILNKFKVAFVKKAYTEGIYSDTPANRKLGRVGMSYAEYAAKQKKEEENISKIEDSDSTIKKNNVERKTIPIGEIKEKVDKEIDKLKRKNDYVTVSTTNGYTFRFSRNMGGKGFNECLVKDKEGKVLKTFRNAYEESLMNSVHKYIQNLGVDIVSSENDNKEEINTEDNTAVIKSKMEEAKNAQTGTIVVKGSGDKLVYLNRDRKGRWLKDFSNYTVRDSKRNVLFQGKAKSEEELIENLNNYLSKNKIKLEA